MKRLIAIIAAFFMGLVVVSTTMAQIDPACTGLLNALENIPPDSPGYDRVLELAQETNCVDVVDINLDERNAYEPIGASGTAIFNPVAEGGIIQLELLQVLDLMPSHEYYVWQLIQPAGEFNPDLQVSPNFFRSSVTTNEAGSFSISMSFPGPALPLSPGTYRIDTFVTLSYPTPQKLLDTEEANLIRSAYLYQSTPLAEYDLLLSSSPFETGIEVVVPEQE